VVIVSGTDSSQDLQDVQCVQKSEGNQVQGEKKSVLMDLLCQIPLETQTFSNSCSSWFAAVTYSTENTIHNVLTLQRLSLTHIQYIHSVRTAQYTHSISVIKTSQLMLYREIIAVWSQIHTKHTSVGRTLEFYLNMNYI
jgi:hypothetical protein